LVYCVGFGVFDLIVIAVAWKPITDDYYQKVAEKEAPPVIYDEFGCDEFGLNVDQQPCRGADIPLEGGYGCED